MSSPEIQNIENGFFVLTNKSMYFAGQHTTFLYSLRFILSLEAYPDGLGLFRSIGAGFSEVSNSGSLVPRQIQQSSVLALGFTEKFDADLCFDSRCRMLIA